MQEKLEMNQTKIVIVDDHKIVRLGIKSYLLGLNDYKLIYEAENTEELFRKIKTEIPDFILMDVVMPGLSGIEACKILKKDHPSIKILILTSQSEKETILNCLEANTDGFLSKDAPREEFVNAINIINAGGVYFGKSAIEIANSFYNNTKKTGAETSVLSAREIEIISLFCEGLSYKEIADKLFLSPRTIETHKNNIQKKLDIKTTVDMVKYAIKYNLVYL